MKTAAITGIALAILLASPLVFAQDTSASAHAISVWDLRFKQIGQGFNDFIFSMRSAITFDEQARVELIKERNDQMKSRQQAWLSVKQSVMANMTNMSADERKEAMKMLQAEHESIIKEHLQMTHDLAKTKLYAKAHMRHDIETEADEAAEHENNSGLALGLGMGLSGNLTSDQAKAIVQSSMGLDGNVRTETRNGQTFYVVTGQKTDAQGNYTLSSNYEVWVAQDGVVASADMNAHLGLVV